MRKISANLIIPVSSDPLRNGIIKLDENGAILDLIDTGGKLVEESGMEFYPGVIVPGLILPWIRMAKRTAVEMDRSLSALGYKGAGLLVSLEDSSDKFFTEISRSSTQFHPVIELCPQEVSGSGSGSYSEAFELFNRGVEVATHAFNDFNLSCSLMSCLRKDCSREENDYLKNLLGQFTLSHENAFPADAGEITEKAENILKRHPRKGLKEIISRYTLEAAENLFLDERLGSIEKGKIPGLNLISGFDAHHLEPVKNVSLKVLA